jgi:hypothetical protein
MEKWKKGIRRVRSKNRNEKKQYKEERRQGMEAHAYNPSTREAKAGKSQIPGQPGLHSETLSERLDNR